MSKKRYRIRNFLIIIVFLVILFDLFLRYYSDVSLEVIEYDDLEETIKVKAVIVKDEAIINADRNGSVNFHYNEGQKVSAGVNLADITGSENGKIHSPKSGLVSYVFDGLENSFKYEEVTSIMPSKLQGIEELIENTANLSTVNNGDKLIKVIYDFKYYMVCLVNNVDIASYEEGKYIRVKFNEDDKIVYGYLEKINLGNDESVLIISFDDFFHKVYNKRIIEASLVKNLYEGLKIHTSAILEKDGIKGVYIKDVSNIIKFVPLEIIGGDEEYSIVSAGESLPGGRGVITINGDTYYTVKVFDKIVLKPDKVYEGQIVD